MITCERSAVAGSRRAQPAESSGPQLLVRLLLTQDLHSSGCDLHPSVRDLHHEPDDEPHRRGIGYQLAFPGWEGSSARRSGGQPGRRHGVAACDPSEDPVVRDYLRRLAAQGAALSGWRAYRYQLRTTLRSAHWLAGRPVPVIQLFMDDRLLGRALVDDTAPSDGAQLSRWTLAQRRSALRSFAALMRPELLAATGEDPHGVLDRALRGVAERVGTGYRLSGGSPRRRGGQTPTTSEVRSVINAAGSVLGYRGLRNRAFLQILASTGIRVNALRQLDTAACIVMPTGRLRLLIREKSKCTLREVELSKELAAALDAYIEGFNAWAVARRWPTRLRLGQPGPLWRNSGRGSWGNGDVRQMLRTACARARVDDIPPHGFRRRYASDAATVLPRHVVAQAGGWQGRERMDDHYVTPRPAAIWHKLRVAAQLADHDTARAKEQRYAPTLVLVE